MTTRVEMAPALVLWALAALVGANPMVELAMSAGIAILVHVQGEDEITSEDDTTIQVDSNPLDPNQMSNENKIPIPSGITDRGTDTDTERVVSQCSEDGSVETGDKAGSGSVEEGQCVCKVMSSWSELAEYEKLQEMRQRLAATENVVTSMNFTAIFERLNNATDRLNSLESLINKQAVAASVTELFDLRKKVEHLVNFVEGSNSSDLVANEKARLKTELQTISEVVDSMWGRNPYRQRDQYKQEVAALRERFSRCHKSTLLPSFQGDSLPVNTSMWEGWCPKDNTMKVGLPVTHKWKQSSHKEMWFKDPKPLTSDSRTQVFELEYQPNYGSYYRKIKRYSSYEMYIGQTTGQDYQVDRQHMWGYGAIIYQNAIYYNYNSYLYKLDLTTKVTTSVMVGFQRVEYRGLNSNTYLDIKADESGLWVIYSISSDNKLAISKLDPQSLLMKKTWMTRVIKTDICAAFMMCGRMYTLKSCNVRFDPNTPNYVYDTVSSKGWSDRYHISSMYGAITQLTYNPRERLLFGYDNGHFVTYPVTWEPAEKRDK